jgi:hypothetical protein
VQEGVWASGPLCFKSPHLLPPLTYINYPEEHVHSEGFRVVFTKKILWKKENRILERNLGKYTGGDA